MTYAFPFDCLKQALGSRAFQSADAVHYQDPSSPFTIDATLGELEVSEGPAGRHAGVKLTIDAGMLKDADKGVFPLAGVVLSIRVAGQMEPVAVVTRHTLSELQQVGLLDAVCTYLNDPGTRYAIDTLEVAPGTMLTGLLAVLSGEPDSAAAFVIPGGLFVDRVIMPVLAASFDVPGFAGAGDLRLLSCAARIVADKLVITARAACLLERGHETTFSMICPHSTRYDAPSGALTFVPDANPLVRLDSAIPAEEDPVFASALKTVINTLSRHLPAVRPAMGRLKVNTAGLNGAVYLQGAWS
jgi:hypothetical protein